VDEKIVFGVRNFGKARENKGMGRGRKERRPS
jgi:hypothetical protein